MKKRLFNQQTEPGAREAQKPQRLSVKAKIMMALFALMLIPQGSWAQLDIYIGGQQVPGEGDLGQEINFSSIISSGSVVYTASTHTLKLTNATIDGNIDWYENDNLYIELEGTNVLRGCITDNLSHYLTFKKAANASSCSLTISPSGVAATAPSAISGFLDVWYKYVYLVSANPIAYASDSPNSKKMLDFQDPSSPTVVSSMSLNSDKEYQRIWVNGTQLIGASISGANLGFSGSPNSDDGGTRTLTLNNYTANGPIVSDLPNLTIQFAGTNKINTDGQSNSSFGAADNAIFSCNPSATLTFEKSGTGTSTLELDGKNTPRAAVAGFASVSYSSGCYMKTANPTLYDPSVGYVSFAQTGYMIDKVTITTDVTYPLWVKGTQVDATNAADVLNEGTSSPTVVFQPASNILELNSTNFTGNIQSALGDLTLSMTGKNTITSPDSGTVIRSAIAGALTLEKAASNASLILHCNQDNPTHPVIQGFSTLSYPDFTLVTSPAASYGNFFDDIYDSNKILGLYYPSQTDNTIKAVNDAEFTSVVNYGLTIAGRTITSANAGNVFASDALYDGKVTFLPDATTNNSGTLTLTDFKKTSSAAAIVSSLDNLTVEFNGDCELGDYGGRDGFIESTNTNATLKFKGGTADSKLELHSNNSNAVVQGFKSVSYEGAYWNYSEPISYDGTSYRSRKYKLQYVTITTTRQYLLWLEATQVSEKNKDDIFDDKTNPRASYNPTDNILTLDNCSFGSMDGLMCGLSSLTLSLKGNNSISASSYAGFSPLYSSVPGATLKIEKATGVNNCSLVLSTYNGTPYSPVVNENGFSVDYDGFDLVVTRGSGTSLSDNTVYDAMLRSLSFGSGDGTSGNPYLIATKEDLKDLGAVVNSGVLDTNGKYFKVTADINCSGLTGFEPIGDMFGTSYTHTFKGTFDGNGKTISNLQITATDYKNYAGLFGYVYDGTINNLTLHNCNFVANNDYNEGCAGTLAGMVDGTSNISDVKVTGTTTVSVSTTNGTYSGYAGAIFGYYKSGTLSNNSYEYTVTADGKTGYTPRGDGYSGVDITTSDGAVLYTQTLSTATVANGTIVPWYTSSNTYTDNGKFAPGQTAYFKVTPATGYAIDASSPKVTYTAAGASQTINGTLETSFSSDGVNVYSFTMPDATDATATASLLVNISDAVYSAMIDPTTYSPTGSLAPTTVKLTPKGGTTITLSNTGTNNDFTITGIVDHSGNSVTEFTKADTYKVTIQGQGSYTGTRANISYTIIPKSATGLTVNVGGTYTYTGSAIVPASANIEVKDGSTTLALNTDYTITSCTNNTNAATSNDASAPTVTITGMGNYDNSTAKGTFTIGKKDITNAATFSAITDQTYTGTEIKPTPTVSIVLVDGAPATDLDSSADFDYGYTNNKGAALSTDASAPTVTVTGKGNFTGTASTKFTIKPKSANGLTVTVGGTYTYTGSAIEPAPTDISVSDGTTSLNYNTDYTISYKNNTNAGTTAEVIITGKGNYDSATNKTGYFTIGQADLAGVTIDAIANQAFTGLALMPPVSVTFNGTPVASSEYNVNYTNNTNVGTATVTLTSTNKNFSTVHSKDANFEIVQTTASITAKDQTVIYNGTPQAIPGVSVDYGTVVITYYKSAADRTANTGGTTTAPTNAATYYVKVTQGDAGYTSVPAEVTFTISPKSATGLTVNVGGTYTYTGSAIEPADADIVVKDGSTTLVLNTDYTITSCTNNTNAATSNDASAPTVTITGMGNYDSSTTASGTFTIGKADFAGVTIDAITNQAFTGSALMPPVSVKFNGTTVDPSEYNVNYTNNTNVGTATVTLTSTNINFSTVNSKVVNFTIAAASATITATNQTVTYNGIPQAIPGVSVDNGTVVITYYNSAADRTTNTGGTTTAPTNAATYYVRVTQSDASYTSVPVDVTFTISPKSANGLTVTVGGPYTYTGSAIEPALSVTDGRTPLTAGTDYTVSYTSNVNVGTATATVTGIGNYTGSIPQTFSIIPKSIKGVSVTIGGTYTYTGAAIVPGDADITVTDGTMALDKDKDYTLSVTNNTNAGTATVTVTGKGNYDSATFETGSFTIDQATITSVTLDQTQFVYAPGVAHSVNVTVMAGSLSVPSGSYTVTVDGVTGNSATAAGTHTVRATARTDIANNFKGYAETTFAITERTVSIDFGGRTFRTFYDGNETFLLPDGITAYIVTGVNGDAVTVKQVSYVLQGIPVLLESTPGTTNVADPAESFTGNLLKYAAAATPATDKHYVLYNNEFVRTSGTINGKVYLDLTGYSGGARSLVIGDGTTAIEGIVRTEDDGDVKWYDMQGRRINKPTKSGVYIKDGKKVVVKTRY